MLFFQRRFSFLADLSLGLAMPCEVKSWIAGRDTGIRCGQELIQLVSHPLSSFGFGMRSVVLFGGVFAKMIQLVSIIFPIVDQFPILTADDR